MDKDKIIGVLEEELIPALGCTDPIAIAYAAALAKKYSKGEIEEVNCILSTNIIKNASAVCIPGTSGRYGVALAAALGAIAGNADLGLQSLKEINESDVNNALELIDKELIHINAADNGKALYIKIELKTDMEEAVVVIEDSYMNVVYISVDDEVHINKTVSKSTIKKQTEVSTDFSLKKILDFANTVPLEDLGIIEEAINLNLKVAEEGISDDYGLSVGKTIKKSIEAGHLCEDLSSVSMMWTASAVDSRMAGCELPAMSNTGSGNQGIAATVPVAAVGKKLNKDREAIIRAVTISNLVTIYIKSKLDLLTSVCGATIAATGASCGVVYLLGGGEKQMEYALHNTLGNVAGMLCDGAKASCSLKIATCTNAGVQAALLALNNISIKESDGIIGKNEKDTINNFVDIVHKGMMMADDVILDIIMKK